MARHWNIILDLLSNILPVIGLALCAMAVCQFALWSTNSIGFFKQKHLRFQRQQQEFREHLKKTIDSRILDEPENLGHWRGFRNFRVDRLEREADNTTSVYLMPVDSKSIAQFKPGQYLTFRFRIPTLIKPIVRCYSLSAGPGKTGYRISVKEVPPPVDRPELGFGKASQYINRQLRVGQHVEVKAPAGDFFLDERSEKPIVLLAGGIGITPMVSMIERLIETNSNRLILLVYGTSNSGDHAFKSYLAAVSSEHSNINLLTCYSKPDSTDRLGVDYQFNGRASAELLQSVLPNQDCEFYLCGPPPFMSSLYKGLIDWGVEKESIRFEAFGPASIGQSEKKAAEVTAAVEPVPIKFAKSEINLNWDGTHDSLLAIAEANEIVIDSGCRAGCCGSCAIEVIEGAVEYPEGQQPQCPPGHCLMCIARPRGPLELGA